mgnify:CR=1 FL=1
MMSNNVHNHEAYETIHKSENTSYVSQTTPNSVNTECELPAPAKYVVPIIFIPGIMGSNIMDTKKNFLVPPLYGGFPRSTVVRWNAKPVDIIPFFTINLHDAVYISPRSSTHTLALNLPC